MLIAFDAPPMSSVYPSGGDFATYSDAMLVIAPGRCSMMTCCFSTGTSLSMIARVMMSVLPPGAKGLTMRTGLTGYACAHAPVDRQAQKHIAPTKTALLIASDTLENRRPLFAE